MVFGRFDKDAAGHSVLGKQRSIKALAAVSMAVVVFAGGCVFVAPPPPPPTLTDDAAPPVQINGIDLHDGMVARFGDTYYMYGTEYGCGFRWTDASTPWCGYGVSTASSLSGPWSAPTPLFSPDSWQSTCVNYGCFNPRMIQRTWGPNDGAFLLWFNAPGDYIRNGTNAYYVMSCDGPAGPCGNAHKPSLSVCSGVGDFSIASDGANAPWIFCTLPLLIPAQEQLDAAGTDGTGIGSRVLAGLGDVEGLGAYHDAAAGTWVLTDSDPSCGYCSGGVKTGDSTGPRIAGAWTPRTPLSADSCGGQPRGVDVIDGHSYEQIDQWYGDLNEAHANTVLAPLAGMSCPSGGSPLPSIRTRAAPPIAALYTP